MRHVTSCLLLLLFGCASAAPRPPTTEPRPTGQSIDAAVRTGYANVNGVKLYYEVRGSGAPVVLLHGGINTFETSFAKFAPALAQRYQVIGIEQVGHGHSPDSDRPNTYEQMADDTAAVLEDLGIPKADLIGWSDGGNIALLVAVRHRDRVRRIVASGANVRLEGVAPKFIEWAREIQPGDPAIAKVREAFERTSPDGPQHWAKLVEKDRALWLTPVVVEKERLASVTAPTMILSGDGDSTLLEHSIEMYRSLPNGQLCVLPATGHRTFDPRTDWLLPIITAFLDAPDRPAK